jgi:hypothetical protein
MIYLGLLVVIIGAIIFRVVMWMAGDPQIDPFFHLGIDQRSLLTPPQ